MDKQCPGVSSSGTVSNLIRCLRMLSEITSDRNCIKCDQGDTFLHFFFFFLNRLRYLEAAKHGFFLNRGWKKGCHGEAALT